MDWLPPIEVSRISDGGKVRKKNRSSYSFKSFAIGTARVWASAAGIVRGAERDLQILERRIKFSLEN